jgi:hypothetical protein
MLNIHEYKSSKEMQDFRTFNRRECKMHRKPQKMSAMYFFAFFAQFSPCSLR